MEIIRGLENVSLTPDAAVTVGSFDGVHLGHRRILQRMRTCGLRPLTVITFDPHPQMVVRTYGEPPPQLTTFEERIGLFEKLGVDRLVVARFDEEFARISAVDFVERVLLEKVGMSRMFVGPRHGFGEGRRGNVEMLAGLGQKHGFGVEVVPPVIREGRFVSSSRIRKCLLAGDALSAFRFLERPYYLFGEVIAGDNRGHQLGFPTANIKSSDLFKLIPQPGVYATITEQNGVRWPSVSHFGVRPTFKTAQPSMETHIIGYNGEIYGEQITIGLIEKLRGTLAFNSPEELAAQIICDKTEASIRLIERGFGQYSRFEERRLGVHED